LKSDCWRYFKRLGVVLSILLLAPVPVSLLNQLENSIGQEQLEAVEGENTTIPDFNFSYPLNSTINLGTPFLVQYDNTTGVNAIGNATLDNFIVTFTGYGILNGL